MPPFPLKLALRQPKRFAKLKAERAGVEHDN
jgi:hypothetical protein